MIFKKIQVGPLYTNCYILADDEKRGILIDPGDEAQKIINEIKDEDVQIEWIILTHGHIDHIGAVKEVKNFTNARVAIHEKDAKMLTSAKENLSFYGGYEVVQPPADVELMGGESIEVGKLTLEIIWTPGHTPGSICIKTGKLLFTGDTLFAGSIGRTDFPGGSYEEIINSIKTKLLVLDDDIRVLPGHGSESTIGVEKATNPFLR